MLYIKRTIERDIRRWLDEREIIVIRGPRQSGKTTMLNRTREILIEKGVREEQIHYISFEDDITRLKFESNCLEFINFQRTKGKNYFLLDEVQYVNDVGKKLKLIFDSNEIKLIITGSSSFDLTTLGKYLVGRVVFFNLYPFSFLEFLRAKGEKYERLYKDIRIDINKVNLKKTAFLDELNRLLHEYLTYGSYPRVVLEKDKTKKRELLKYLFVTYVEKDVVSLYGNRFRDKVVKLLKALSSMLGGIIKYETLTINSGLKYHEVREIMPLLEDSFIIFITKPFYKNIVNELRKNPKVYFVDYGMSNYLTDSFDNLLYDKLYENFIHNELKRAHDIKYWRTAAKTEVDFVIDNITPLEVKSSSKVTRALRSFISSYKPKNAFIANINHLEKGKIEDCDLFVVPFVYF